LQALPTALGVSGPFPVVDLDNDGDVDLAGADGWLENAPSNSRQDPTFLPRQAYDHPLLPVSERPPTPGPMVAVCRARIAFLRGPVAVCRAGIAFLRSQAAPY
jgi:hypothetical protein